MHPVLPLATLGRRIIILGPSNAGKSTLAAALARKLDISVVHIDLLHHQPNTNWVPRPKAEFVALHDAAIEGESWVMEGNYMGLFPQRAARATGIIMPGSRRWPALFRYVRRTLLQRKRVGMLAGGEDRLNLTMMRFIMIEQPPKRARDVALARATGLPLIELHSMAELKALYAAWDLPRP